MSPVCEYEIIGDSSPCTDYNFVYPTYDSTLDCKEMCNSLHDCWGYFSSEDSTRCWIIMEEAPTIVYYGFGGAGSCLRKIPETCQLPGLMQTRELEKCNAQCIFDIIFAIPLLVLWGFAALILLCAICMLPCMCIESYCSNPKPYDVAVRAQQNEQNDTPSATENPGDQTESEENSIVVEMAPVNEDEDTSGSNSATEPSMDIENKLVAIPVDDEEAFSPHESEMCQEYFL